MKKSDTPRVVFVPGNGSATTQDNWFPAVKRQLQEKGYEVLDAIFPDSDLARESYWMPFLINDLKVDENTILIGHSSGAVAAMRFAEKQRILGSVLVGTYYTDLGMEKERLSGYFDRPWDWEAISKNQQWTVLFASQDDPWIPIQEPRYIHEKLQCEYHEFTNQGHFGGDYFKPDFDELVLSVINNVQRKNGQAKT